MEKKYTQNGVALFVRLPEDLVSEVDGKAKEHGLSRNDVVKLILKEFFRGGGKLIL